MNAVEFRDARGGKVLVLQGTDDPFVPAAQIAVGRGRQCQGRPSVVGAMNDFFGEIFRKS